MVQSLLASHSQQPPSHLPLLQVSMHCPPLQRVLPFVGARQVSPDTHRPIELHVCGVFPEQPLASGEHSPPHDPFKQARPGQSAWLSH
jgi:hypothetical protein